MTIDRRLGPERTLARRRRPDPTMARRPAKGAIRSVSGGLAASFLALALLSFVHGTAQAVAIRTSDGLALATPGPVAPPTPNSVPDAAANPDAAITRSPAAPDDWFVAVLGLAATAGFARGLWLLRLPGRRPESTSSSS